MAGVRRRQVAATQPLWTGGPTATTAAAASTPLRSSRRQRPGRETYRTATRNRINRHGRRPRRRGSSSPAKVAGRLRRNKKLEKGLDAKP